jgi:hypothetical protein
VRSPVETSSDIFLKVIGGLSTIGFMLSVAVLIATMLGTRWRLLAAVRWASVLGTGALVCASLFDLVASWAPLVLSCLGFVISLRAVALRFRPPPLRSYVDPDSGAGEPTWWTEFERDFRSYAARHASERRGTG